MGCKYPDNTWNEEPNDLDKDCEQCYLKMCLRICKRLFYIFDLSYIIKKMNSQLFIMSFFVVFFNVFGVGYYFDNIERSEKKKDNFIKILINFFKSIVENVNK